MKYLVALLLFLGTLSAQAASINTDSKVIIGGSSAGVFFMVEGQPAPWLCRPEGGGVVTCDAQGKRYMCRYQDEPVFFDSCKDNGDEVPMGITVVPSGI